MAITIASQLTTLSSAESTTGWTAFNISGAVGALAALAAADEEMPPREGTYCLGWDQDIENGGYYYGITSTNYSNYHVYIWASSFTAAACAVSNPGSGQSGVYIYARDSSGNAGYWHVGGSDTYKGGWKCFVAYLGNSPDTNSGTAPNMAQCTGIGIGFNHSAKSKLAHNMFIDFLRVGASGSGIQVSTTSGSVATWDDIAAGDESAAIGICRKESGVYFLQGPVIFGNTSTLSCQFADSGKVVVFEDAAVNYGNHYKLLFNAYSGGTHEYTFGSKVGGQGVRGGQIIGLQPWGLTCTSAYIDKFQFYGVGFVNAFSSFGAADGTTPSNREVISCNFSEGSTPVTTTGATLQYCNFIAAALWGAKYHANITDSNFINCPIGMYYDTAGTYDCNGNKFYGCTVDVENYDLSTYLTSNPLSNFSGYNNMNNTYIHAMTFVGDGSDITWAGFYLAALEGTPAGYMAAFLYATSSGVPTGSPIATFSEVDHEVIAAHEPSGFSLIGFGLDTPFTTVNGTVYALAILSAGHDASNYCQIGYGPGAGYSGFYYQFTGASWNVMATFDLIFYVGNNDLLTLNKVNGANPITSLPSGDTIVKIQASITLEMVVTDENGDEVSGAYAYIDDNDTSPYILNTTTNASGIASTSYVGAAVVGSRWRVRKYGYKPYRQLVDISSESISLPVTLIADPQQT